MKSELCSFEMQLRFLLIKEVVSHFGGSGFGPKNAYQKQLWGSTREQ